jgi:hypothetical protein
MGIKKFYNLFTHTKIIKLKELKGKTITIDASYEIYRSSLGSEKINTLTDKNGNPTLHINTLLHNIVEMYLAGINQIWIFDYSNEAYINPLKYEEILKRKQKRNDAIQKLNNMKEELFSDSEDELCNTQSALADEQSKAEQSIADEQSKAEQSIAQSIAQMLTAGQMLNAQLLNVEQVEHVEPEHANQPNQPEQTPDQAKTERENNLKKKHLLEKQAFTITKFMIDDIKLILDCLNIHYIVSPKGYEAEQIASYLSATDQCDGVYSGDTDPIAFGAKIHYRKHPKTKKILQYTRDDILLQIKKNSSVKKPNLNIIRKIAVILGCDFAAKTPRIGEKTVLKKLNEIELTTQQIEAIEQFKKIPTDDIEVSNYDKTPFIDCNYKFLLNWLVNEKSFAKRRIENMFEKIKKQQIVESEN